jgi:hypothetical protein
MLEYLGWGLVFAIGPSALWRAGHREPPRGRYGGPYDR